MKQLTNECLQNDDNNLTLQNNELKQLTQEHQNGMMMMQIDDHYY
jgi:hypothetical protein